MCPTLNHIGQREKNEEEKMYLYLHMSVAGLLKLKLAQAKESQLGLLSSAW